MVGLKLILSAIESRTIEEDQVGKDQNPWSLSEKEEKIQSGGGGGDPHGRKELRKETWATRVSMKILIIIAGEKN